MSDKKHPGRFGEHASTKTRTSPVLKGLERRSRSRRNAARRRTDSDEVLQDSPVETGEASTAVQFTAARAVVELARLRGAVDGAMVAIEMLARSPGANGVGMPAEGPPGEHAARVAYEYANLLENAAESARQFCELATDLVTGLGQHHKK